MFTGELVLLLLRRKTGVSSVSHSLRIQSVVADIGKTAGSQSVGEPQTFTLPHDEIGIAVREEIHGIVYLSRIRREG